MRIDVVAQPVWNTFASAGSHGASENFVRFTQHIEHHRESTRQFSQHTNVLCPLTWEENSQFSGQTTATVIGSVWRRPCPLFRIPLEHCHHTGNKFAKIGFFSFDDQKKTMRVLGTELVSAVSGEASNVAPCGCCQRGQLRSNVFDQIAQAHL